MATTVQFVDSIASSPTVRLDLNTDPWLVTLDGTNLSPPPIRRASAQTLMSDGAFIPATAYDNRTLIMHLELVHTSQDNAATEMQKLARELNRETNILKYQPGTTSPVFFRTLRSPDYQWTVANDSGSPYMYADVEIVAEPFAYGLLETPVSAQSLDTNPASANGHYLDASSIKGDVETPAMIRWPASAVAASRETLFAVRRRGTPSAAPFLFQAENQTNGTDTTDTVNASFSGGNGTRTTFATTSMQTRLTISDLGTASVDLRGTYRVFARYAKTTSGDTIACQLVWGTSGGSTTTNDSITLPTGTGIYMMDLGLIQVPRGWDPVTHLLSGAEVAASDTFHLAFQASRSGAGNLDLDYLILVPADDRLGIVKWVEAGPSYWWLNAHNNSASAMSASDTVASGASPALSGGLPMLAPNQTNRLYMIYEVGSGLATTLTTVTVTVSYYPRYLTIRPAST